MRDLEFRDSIFISDQGLYGEWWSDQEKVWIPFKVKNPVAALRNHCVIKPGTTLRDIFCIVRDSKSLFNFIKNYCHITSLSDWLSFLDKEKKSKDHYKHVELGWKLDIFESEQGYDLYPDVFIFGEQEGRPETFCLDLSVEYVLDIPIKVSNKPKIYDFSSNKFKEEYAKFDKEFTLLNILDTIFYQISFFGSPENTKAISEEIENRVSEIKESEALGILTKSYSFDEVREKLNKSINQKKQSPCHHCGEMNNELDSFSLKNFDSIMGQGTIVCNICDKEIKEIMFDSDDPPKGEKDECY